MNRHQIIRSQGAEELVVLTRAEYDALRAAAGDTDAEVRAASRIVEDSNAAVARGEEVLLPAWLAIAVVRGETPVKVVRKHLGRTQQELAAALGVTQGYLSEMESGKKAPNAEMRARLADALDVDPRWLDDVDHEDAPTR